MRCGNGPAGMLILRGRDCSPDRVSGQYARKRNGKRIGNGQAGMPILRGVGTASAELWNILAKDHGGAGNPGFVWNRPT